MSSEKRKYEQKARAQKQEETRQRIAAATAELHSTIGPAKTTIAEIAKRAGVQRPTVYNNFATEKELLTACQAHFMNENPPPELSGDLETILTRLYGWYRRTEGMTGNVARDRGAVPALDELLREGFDAVMDSLADALSSDGDVRALIRVALAFETWKTLKTRGLSDAKAAHLMASAAS